MSKAVENSQLIYTSVSAVKKHLSCSTAWWFRYVDGRPEPQGKGAELGEKLHAEVEHYLTTGENILGDIARTGLHLLPEPGNDLWVEVEFGPASGFELECDGVPFKGFIDLVDARRVLREGLLVITDHKFKGDPQKYGTTPERLKDPADDDGLQMVGYAMAAYNAVKAGRFPGVETIRLRHIHYKTKPPLVPAVDIYVDVPLKAVPFLWEKALPLVRAMRETAKAASAAATKGNLGACWKYGGCAFRHDCPHFGSPKQEDRSARIRQLLSTTRKEEMNPMGILSKKIQSNTVPAPAAVVAAPVATAPATAPATPPATPAKQSLIVDESTTPDAVVAANPNRGQRVAPVAAVLPPDAPTPTKAAAPAAPVAPVQTIQSESPVATVEAPKKRGRPTKEEQAAKAAAQGEFTKAAATAEGGFILYIGCAGKKTVPLQAYVEGLEGIVLEKFRTEFKLDVPDIRLSHGNDVGFGKWKPVIQAFAKENPPAPGRYHVLGFPTGDERIDAVVTALESLAQDVVR